MGEAAPAAFPVIVSIEGHGAALTIGVDGQSHSLSSVVGPSFRGISLEQPGPLEREYQVDGSDTTSTADRHLSPMQSMLSSPLYQFDASKSHQPPDPLPVTVGSGVIPGVNPPSSVKPLQFTKPLIAIDTNNSEVQDNCFQIDQAASGITIEGLSKRYELLRSGVKPAQTLREALTDSVRGIGQCLRRSRRRPAPRKRAWSCICAGRLPAARCAGAACP